MVVVVVAVVAMRLGIVLGCCIQQVFGHEVMVHVRTCPSLDEIEGVIEDACGDQSFKVFFDSPEASGEE